MQEITALAPQVVFISGRFRSGTSMLWNIFRQLDDYCAWYEPLHPNLLAHIKYVKPKEDHIGIDDYWHNYTKLTHLAKKHSVEFGQKNLYMEKHHNWQELKNYITYLIKSSADRIPVLQFNRMDLRLSWLKNNFPEACIIHIEREPFALWKSSRKHIKTHRCQEHESYPDAYDLMQWSVDIAKYFPMLQAEKDRSSYYRHYFIWKLAQKLAKKNADISLSLENDFLYSHDGIAKLGDYFNWNDDAVKKVETLIKKPESMHTPLKKSKKYTAIESSINQEFEELGLNRLFPSNKISTIKQEHHHFWKNYTYNPDNCIQELLNTMKFQKDELTALLNTDI